MGKPILKKGQYLGTLCKRGHDYKGTGLSIRYTKKGEALGGVCVACNIAYHKKRGKEKAKYKARRDDENKTIAICPMCEKTHKITIEGGWIGNGTPRKYCPYCLKVKDNLTAGAFDY